MDYMAINVVHYTKDDADEYLDKALGSTRLTTNVSCITIYDIDEGESYLPFLTM